LILRDDYAKLLLFGLALIAVIFLLIFLISMKLKHKLILITSVRNQEALKNEQIVGITNDG